MEINKLPKITNKSKKRVGRGAGSGRGKTSGRGQKGQGARGTVKLLYEGGQLPLIKRLPLLRGKGKNKPRGKKATVVNVKYLNLLPAGSVVNFENLVKFKIIKLEEDEKFSIKILGEGELEKALIVELPCSKGAIKKILKAGGKVENLQPETTSAKQKRIKSQKLKIKSNS